MKYEKAQFTVYCKDIDGRQLEYTFLWTGDNFPDQERIINEFSLELMSNVSILPTKPIPHFFEGVENFQTWHFDRFVICLTAEDIDACYHPGECDDDVAEVVRKPYIKDQFDRIDPQLLVDELMEYGAWDDKYIIPDTIDPRDSRQHRDNMKKIVWLAAGNIYDEYKVAE